jgi:hypothetical protein
MNNIESYWPEEIGEFQGTTPVSILRQQAELLGGRTEEIVLGVVRSYSDDEYFVHDLALEVPALRYYRYELLSIRHNVNLYPVDGTFDSYVRNLPTEREFRDWLKSVLTSGKTKQVLQTLIAQAKNK